ncbi:hypothetical protein [Flavobacterium sp. 2]|uniref:hypothetical protein n=1 Tax=Flavobacterium sp. 2 TaxID=308053 RepID=UPI003CF19E3B
MENKYIRFEKLSKWNIITVFSYLLISFFLFPYCLNSKFERKDILFMYGLGTQLFIYFFQYRALRNFNYFLIWIVIGIIHFFIFIGIKDDPQFALAHGNATLGLRNTIISLALFQFLRFMSLIIQDKEFVVPSKGSSYDLFFERKLTIIDVICFIIFMGVTIFLIL